MKKVSAAQIERLYQFTRQHYVEYDDVQNELVDHLANAIETHWEENPEQEFEFLLEKEFKKFGIYGFLEVVEQRQRALEKHYHKLLWNEAKTFLKMPKVLFMAILVFLIMQFLLKIESAHFWLIGLLIFIYTISGGYALVRFLKFKKEKKKASKPNYLLEKLLVRDIDTGFNSFIALALYIYCLVIEHFYVLNFWVNLLTASFFVLFCLCFLIMSFILPQKKEVILHKTYPELRFQ